MANLVGVDHVALGPDYVDYVAEYVAEMLRRLPGVYKTDKIVFPEGLDDVTKLPKITEALLKKGYSESDVRKILGENLLRVFEQAVG